jgi:DNA modification methylase
VNAIRDRITDFRRVRARDLLPHPANWRRHPEAQREALRGMLEEIGYAGALLAREVGDGRLQLIDGHLRAETTPDHEVPVLILDVTEAEAEKLLVSIDPLAALAERDDSALRQLLDRVGSENARVQAFLAGLRAQLPPVLPQATPLEAKPLPPGFADIRCGHVLDVLRTMPDESVHCVVTSPPYWGLRDYGLEPLIWGGDPACGHEWGDELKEHLGDSNRDVSGGFSNPLGTRGNQPSARAMDTVASRGAFCSRCQAWRGSLGLEPDPTSYVQHMAEVFREVRRVLRRDGTLWLNLGDSYATATNGGPAQSDKTTMTGGRKDFTVPARILGELKPKDLLGMPWRVAFALQQDGWYLRSDIIWAKPNPMPESVTDRPTKAHEYLFLLARSERYYYDAEAIRDPGTGLPWNSAKSTLAANGVKNIILNQTGQRMTAGADTFHPDETQFGRNKRTVWEIATQPYPDAHFATFPEALVEPCVMAGTSERGCCGRCGAPWEREVKIDRPDLSAFSYRNTSKHDPGMKRNDGDSAVGRLRGQEFNELTHRSTIGWSPTCTCDAATVPATVLDPFAGSGTALLVAKRLKRSALGIELSEEYCKLITHRLAEIVPDA